MPFPRMFEQELEEHHVRVLAVMKDDRYLTLQGITEAFVKQYTKSVEVAKWNGRIGDISRYHIARYLKTLEREGYVDRSNESPFRWRRLRQDSLLNEVVQGYVFEGKAKNRIEAVRKLADAYLDDHKTEFQQYVFAMRKARQIDEMKNQELEDTLEEAKKALEKLRSKKEQRTS